jgi:hypothetical protein
VEFITDDSFDWKHANPKQREKNGTECNRVRKSNFTSHGRKIVLGWGKKSELMMKISFFL